MTTLFDRTPARAGASPIATPPGPAAMDADRVDALMAEFGLVGDFLDLGGVAMGDAPARAGVRSKSVVMSVSPAGSRPAANE